MIKYDYITGLPVSEPLMTDINDTSDQYALNLSNNYNDQMYQGNNWNGYYNNQQQFYGAPMNTPYNPYQQQYYGFNGYQGNPYYNQYQQQYYGFNGYQGNPYYNPQGGMTQQIGVYDPFSQQAFYYQQQQPVMQDKVVHVEGYNPFGSRGLLSSDAEERCDKLQEEAMIAQQKAMAEREKRIQGYFNDNYGGYNYYGMPYVNMIDQNVYNNYMSEIRSMADAAIRRRIDFNKSISRMVHGYLNDNVTDEQIDMLYEGYDYTIPGSTLQTQVTESRLYNCVPVNNAWMYQQHAAMVSEMYHAIAPSDNMNDFLRDAGLSILADKLEDQIHRRKDDSRLYSSDTYHNYIRKYAMEHDIQLKQDQLKKEVRSGIYDHLPTTREEAARILLGDAVAKEMAEFKERMNSLDNGFIPIGNPDNLGTPVVMSDELTNEFELRRGAFIDSIYKKKSYAQKNYENGVT